ncbi:MAG TPA: VTT domain-containing protein [Blastocatellia bacterium]|nr:VTT domain-containing protein [Blastocatellia bacterium]
MGFIWIYLLEVWRTLRRLGGLGLILMGLVDSSVIPTPGGLDALTIVLTAHERDEWIYYAVMATIGSVLGGYVTYRLGRKGGERALERRFSKQRIEQVHRAFERWGFATIFVPALLPPPAPLGPFLLGAGAMNYPLPKYLVTLTVARAIRFTLVAYLASIFGQRVFRFFMRHYTVMLWSLIALAVLAGLAVTIYILRRRRQRAAHELSQDRAA